MLRLEYRLAVFEEDAMLRTFMDSMEHDLDKPDDEEEGHRGGGVGVGVKRHLAFRNPMDLARFEQKQPGNGGHDGDEGAPAAAAISPPAAGGAHVLNPLVVAERSFSMGLDVRGK